MNKVTCFLKGIVRSIQIGWPFNYPMEGHTYKEEETHKNVTVVIGRCEDCGEIDISWHR